LTSALGTPLDVVPLLQPERAVLIELLEGLTAAEWDLPTECPAWTVKGIALHVLGDDFSLLSRQRDAATDGLALWAPRHPGVDFRTLLDTFNEDWVDAARFFSTGVLIDLLRASGELTHAWYAGVGGETLGEPVPFVGWDPAPYWMIAAREHLERWVHQQQIRRAVGQVEWVDDVHLRAAIGAVMRGFPQALALLDTSPSASIALVLEGGAGIWTVARNRETWAVVDVSEADAILTMSSAAAASLVSRARPAADVPRSIDVSGDVALGRAVVEGLALIFGRPNEETA
jgi:uncharacterized protein (TIGR03083 family)